MKDRGVAVGDVVSAFSLTAGHCPGADPRFDQGGFPYATVKKKSYTPGTAADAALLRPRLFSYRSTKVWVRPGKTIDVPSFESKHTNTRGRNVCFMSKVRKYPICGQITKLSMV